jgi:tetratricopeptide (TPR) repeat protein
MTSFNAPRGRTMVTASPRPSAPVPAPATGASSSNAGSAMGAAQVEECLAVAALAMQDWQALALHCERLAALTPERFEIWLNLAASLVHLGRGEEAVAAASQAVRLQGNSGEAHLNLALALHQAGRGEESAPHYRQAIQHGAATAEAHWNLSLLESAGGATAAAVDHLSKVATQDAAWKRDMQSERGALMLALDRATEAVPVLRSAAQADEGDLQARFNLGLALLRTGEAAQALEAFEVVRNHEMGNVDVLWAVAVAASAAGDGKRLSAARRSLRDQGETITELTFHLALHLEDQGRDADAMKAYSEVLKERPLCAEALANLSQVLSRLGQDEQSQACWQRAVSLKPEFAAA